MSQLVLGVQERGKKNYRTLWMKLKPNLRQMLWHFGSYGKGIPSKDKFPKRPTTKGKCISSGHLSVRLSLSLFIDVYESSHYSQHRVLHVGHGNKWHSNIYHIGKPIIPWYFAMWMVCVPLSSCSVHLLTSSLRVHVHEALRWFGILQVPCANTMQNCTSSCFESPGLNHGRIAYVREVHDSMVAGKRQKDEQMLLSQGRLPQGLLINKSISRPDCFGARMIIFGTNVLIF